MLEEITKFLSPATIITLVFGLLVSVIGPLGQWRSDSKVRKERIKKAKEALIDLLEGMIVNNEVINHTKLRKMFRAIEREIDVVIGLDYDIERLFEDVILRFQRSKHLEASLKSNYLKKLVRLAGSLKASEDKGVTEVIPKPYSLILDQLKASITKDDKKSIKKSINQLENKLLKSDNDVALINVIFEPINVILEPINLIVSLQKNFIRKHPGLAILVVIVYVLAIIFVVLNFEPVAKP